MRISTTAFELVYRQDLEDTVNKVVEKHGRSRSKLIPILQEIQGIFKYLPRRALEIVAEKLETPLSEILAVATFYHQFRLEPVGEFILQVCFGTACYLRGSADVYEAIKLAALNHPVTVEKARCFGCCSLAPVVMVIDTSTGEKLVHGKLTPTEARKLAFKYISEARRRSNVAK